MTTNKTPHPYSWHNASRGKGRTPQTFRTTNPKHKSGNPMQTLTLPTPDDLHIHLRDGAALARTVPDAAAATPVPPPL